MRDPRDAALDIVALFSHPTERNDAACLGRVIERDRIEAKLEVLRELQRRAVAWQQENGIADARETADDGGDKIALMSWGIMWRALVAELEAGKDGGK